MLNAGKTTNFVFKLNNVISESDRCLINELGPKTGKILKRMEEVLIKSGGVSYYEMHSKLFHNNLMLIDSHLPFILSALVLKFYTSGLKTLAELVNWLEEENPLRLDLSFRHKYYHAKLKRFLVDVALGMMPSRLWAGQYEATGGYVVVKTEGDIVCYHFYNRNEFENYLLNNTVLETASSTRHQFGEVYAENNAQYINLNLQIRFCK